MDGDSLAFLSGVDLHMSLFDLNISYLNLPNCYDEKPTFPSISHVGLSLCIRSDELARQL